MISISTPARKQELPASAVLKPETHLATPLPIVVQRARGLGAYIHSGSWRWDSPLIPGSYLRDSNEYYLEFHADARPEGFNTHTLPAFESPLFNCYGTPDDICYFP